MTGCRPGADGPGPLGAVRRDRASYGVDGGYGGIAVFVLAVGGLLAGERWASRRGKRLAMSTKASRIAARTRMNLTAPPSGWVSFRSVPGSGAASRSGRMTAP